ncbi:hypothetical protein MLAC_19990 [Mycobacterium lacus]|uniref:Uncharacterized protein n=1 Tax=Mycobacterium lacus TaxID=169765 RepID=A0A7I7NJ98_9MYCO|nr:hypothetical protein MLAC_19990 [Mycobacterium lacus]
MVALPTVQLGRRVWAMPERPQLRHPLAVSAEQPGNAAAPEVPRLRDPVVDRHAKARTFALTRAAPVPVCATEGGWVARAGGHHAHTALIRQIGSMNHL